MRLVSDFSEEDCLFIATEDDEREWRAALDAAQVRNQDGVLDALDRYLDFLDHDEANVYELSAFDVTNRDSIRDAGGWGSKANLIAHAKGRPEVQRLTRRGLDFDAEALYLISGKAIPTVGLGYPRRGAWQVMDKHATDEQILERRVLPFDLDPAREPKERSATSDEHTLAVRAGKLLTCYLWECLDRLGKSRSCLAFGPSGNGFHCLLAVSIPEASEVSGLYTSILQAARRRVRTWIDTGVDVDLTLSNASRLLPIYGTKKCKGGEDPELKIRHRWSYLAAQRPAERLSLENLRALLVMMLDGLPEVAPKEPTARVVSTTTLPKTSKSKSNPESAAAWRAFRDALAAVPLEAILSNEGLLDDRGKPICPGHGEAARGTDVAIISSRNGQSQLLNCQHARCVGRGDCQNTKGTNWTGLGVVKERRNCDWKTAQDILAQAFGIAKPKGRPQKNGGKKLAAQVLSAAGESPNVSRTNVEAVGRAVRRLALEGEEIVALAKLLKGRKWQDRQVELLLGQGVLEQIADEVPELVMLLDEKRQPLLTQLLCFAEPMIATASKDLTEKFVATSELVGQIPALSSKAACSLLAYRVHAYAECDDRGDLTFPFSVDAVDPDSLVPRDGLPWPSIVVEDGSVSTRDMVVDALLERQKLTGLQGALEPMKAPNAAHVKTALMFMEANDQIKYDRFTQEATYIRDDPAWGTRVGHIITDAHDVILQNEVQKFIGVPVGIESVRGGVKAFTRTYWYDAAQDWLDSLPPWDGVERIQNLMSLCKMHRGPVQRMIFYYWITQIVRRIQNAEIPAKADYVLVLVGRQGASKSTIFEEFGLRKWTYTMNLADLKDRNRLSRKVQGKLIVNIDELAGGSAADRETVKAFISSVYEEYDVKWQRAIEKAPRRFAFGGTSNWDDILKDPTGNRRYGPIGVDKADDQEQRAWAEDLPVLWPLVMAEVRDQLAEGARYYPDRAEEDFIERYQEGLGFVFEDQVDQRVVRNVETLLQRGVSAARVWEIWTLTRIPTERTTVDDFGREHESPEFRSFESFCRDKRLGHQIDEAIKKLVKNPRDKVRRGDGSRERHVILMQALGASHTTLDDTGDLSPTPKPRASKPGGNDAVDWPN